MPFVNGLHQSLHCLKLHYIWDPLCFIFSFFSSFSQFNDCNRIKCTKPCALSPIFSSLQMAPQYIYKNSKLVTPVSISSGQRNLMKTYHNDANTSRITRIALKKFWTFFDKEDRLAKLQKIRFIEEYQFKTTTFAKIIF